MQPLLAPPRGGHDVATVQAALANPSPYIVHGATLLEPDTLEEVGVTLPVDATRGGTVTWAFRADSATSQAAVRRTATLNLTGPFDRTLLLRYLVRIWTRHHTPDGTPVDFWLGVFTATLPPLVDDGIALAAPLTLAGREHQWATRTIGSYTDVPAGTDVFQLIRDDLDNEFGIVGDELVDPDDPLLDEPIAFPAATSYLEKWSRLLATLGYDQVISTEAGVPAARPLADLADRGAEWTYGPGVGRVVTAGQIAPVDPTVPNQIRYVARATPGLPRPIEGNGYITLTNIDQGPGSVEQRGYIVESEIVLDAVSQTDLETLAYGRAPRDFAGGGHRWQGQVGLNPLHSDRDRIWLDRPRLGFVGTADVTSWTYPLRRFDGPAAALMNLTAEAVISPTAAEESS